MSFKKRSQYAQPAKPISQNELGSHNTGFRLPKIKWSLQRNDEIDNMRGKMLKQEKEIQKYKAAMGKLQKALKDNCFSSHIHFGNVQYGTGNVLVVDQAKDVIEELCKMMTEALSNIAELKHTADRNEALLKECVETVKTCISDMKSLETEAKSKLETEIAELLANHSDEQVLVEGISALKEENNHGRMITSFDSMPKKSRRAVQRLVRKYETRFSAKVFDQLLTMTSTNTLQKVINGEDTDQHIALDEERLAASVIEWAKNPDNTPEKFLDIVQNIDKILVDEETKKLVAEKTEALEKELTKNQGDAVSNSSDGSTIQVIRDQVSEEKSGHQLVTDQMDDIHDFWDFVLELQNRMDEMQKTQDVTKEMTLQVKTMQEKTITILESQNPFLGRRPSPPDCFAKTHFKPKPK